MLTAIAALLLAGTGAGIQHRGGGQDSVPYVMGPFPVAGGLLAGGGIAEWIAPGRHQVLGITWNEGTAGIGTSMAYRLLVDGVEACAITVSCDVSSRQEATCSADVPAGAVLRLEVKTDSCAVGNPSGGLLLTVK